MNRDRETAAPKIVDSSFVAILLSNAFTIGLAFFQDWDLRPILIVYWAQSVIIGVFNFARMIMLKNFSTAGLTSNGNPVPETSKGKWSTALFFAGHYGIFHLFYGAMILGSALQGSSDGFGGGWQPNKAELLGIALGIAGFFCSHCFSFRKNLEDDLKGRPNLGTMMFLPYARVVPMHLTLILGMGMGLMSNRFMTLFFLLLKTAADLLMHVVEHRVLQQR